MPSYVLSNPSSPHETYPAALLENNRLSSHSRIGTSLPEVCWIVILFIGLEIMRKSRGRFWEGQAHSLLRRLLFLSPLCWSQGNRVHLFQQKEKATSVDPWSSEDSCGSKFSIISTGDILDCAFSLFIILSLLWCLGSDSQHSLPSACRRWKSF